jgi:hypothetical protein
MQAKWNWRERALHPRGNAARESGSELPDRMACPHNRKAALSGGFEFD